MRASRPSCAFSYLYRNLLCLYRNIFFPNLGEKTCISSTGWDLLCKQLRSPTSEVVVIFIDRISATLGRVLHAKAGCAAARAQCEEEGVGILLGLEGLAEGHPPTASKKKSRAAVVARAKACMPWRSATVWAQLRVFSGTEDLW